MSDTTKSIDDELRDLLQEFVLFRDDTPYSNEPTELSVYLRQCGFDDAIDRLHDELAELFTKQLKEAEIRARLVELDLLEQFINRESIHGAMARYKLQRLDDLLRRLEDTKGGTDDTPRV